jgi:hypothetical protein
MILCTFPSKAEPWNLLLVQHGTRGECTETIAPWLRRKPLLLLHPCAHQQTPQRCPVSAREGFALVQDDAQSRLGLKPPEESLHAVTT